MCFFFIYFIRLPESPRIYVFRSFFLRLFTLMKIRCSNISLCFSQSLHTRCYYFSQYCLLFSSFLLLYRAIILWYSFCSPAIKYLYFFAVIVLMKSGFYCYCLTFLSCSYLSTFQSHLVIFFRLCSSSRFLWLSVAHIYISRNFFFVHICLILICFFDDFYLLFDILFLSYCLVLYFR